MTDEEELALIKKVAQKDSLALAKLVNKYEPLFNKVKRTYFVRGYDDHDWHQEAMCICYQACLSFHAEKGKFSSYLQRQYRNHVHSLLRACLADCRRADAEATSLDGLTELGYEGILANNVQPFENSITEISRDFQQRLSKKELIVFDILLGIIDEEEARRKWQLSKKQLRSARCRLYHKFKDSLY